MGNANRIYGHYISKLKRNRTNNLAYQQASRNISKMTQPYKHLSQKMTQSLTNNNAPESAKQQLNLDQVRQFNEQSYNIMNEASMQDAERQMGLNEKIADLEFKRDEAVRQEKEQKKREKDEKKRSYMKLGGQLLGAGVGAVAGYATGGLSYIASGAQIGSGILGTAGALADGGVKQDFESAYQGIADTLGGISEASNLYETKQFNDQLLESLSNSDMTSEDIRKLMMIIGKGDSNSLKKWNEIMKKRVKRPASYEPDNGF